jgi:cytochrome c-type biogenesis protein CcmH/NrfG
MKLQIVRTLLLSAIAAITLLAAGCTAKARAERHLKRGDAFFEKRQWSKAKLEYLNALRANSQNVYLVNRLAETFLNDHEFGPAHQFLSRARELQPTNITTRVRLASLLLAGNEKKKAQQEAEAVLKLDPQNAEGIIL